MLALVTGLSGAVGTALKKELESRGIETVGWDRSRVSIDNYRAMEDFVGSVRPDYFFHLAIASQFTGRENEGWAVNYEWPSETAWICRVFSIPFLFTSSAMVFSGKAGGPFTPESVPDASEGYGWEKRMAENRVFYQKPDAYVARLGWQIGDSAGSNNMIDFFEKAMAEKGEIAASSKWLPACSFLPDTARALCDLVTNRTADFKPGLYQFDSNVKWNFYDIASALKKYCRKPGWKIRRDDSFVYDQRLIDPRVQMPPLSSRLKGLK